MSRLTASSASWASAISRRVSFTSWGVSRLTDRLHFEPHVAFLGPLYAPVFRAVFRWRHYNLRRSFGVPSRAKIVGAPGGSLPPG